MSKRTQNNQLDEATQHILTEQTDYKRGYVREYLDTLLRDRTTGGYIHFNTDNYESFGYHFGDEMTPEAVLSLDIKPRLLKSKNIQDTRKKEKAEVFTPTWVVDQMLNYVAEDLHKDNWQEYVLSNQLEITCGEAPFIVSRYDTSTGEMIPTEKRVGMLDRKIRVLSENIRFVDINNWLNWIIKAYQSTYGYEWSGDNLLIARINLFRTFFDYAWLGDMYAAERCRDTVKQIANIISWNIWQMDGLTDMLPGTDIPAKIKNWKAGEVIEFRSIKEQKEN